MARHLEVLGPSSRCRLFPTGKSLEAADSAEQVRERFLTKYSVCREWFRLLMDRLNAVAALVDATDPQDWPVLVGPGVAVSQTFSFAVMQQGRLELEQSPDSGQRVTFAR